MFLPVHHLVKEFSLAFSIGTLMNVHAGNIPDGACKQVYTVYTNTVVSSGSVAAECFEQKLVPRYLVPGFFLFYTYNECIPVPGILPGTSTSTSTRFQVPYTDTLYSVHSSLLWCFDVFPNISIQGVSSWSRLDWRNAR